jgi:thiamine pyrophosphate-dependent acetolactate synthase large subunit-like protein
MSGLELAVAVREKLALTVIVFNDGYLNQIRMQQLQSSGQGHGVALPVIDFRALAMRSEPTMQPATPRFLSASAQPRAVRA